MYREIKRVFPKKADFTAFLQSKLDPTNPVVSKDQILTTIAEFCESNNINKLSKRDFEGFMSLFNYNKHG